MATVRTQNATLTIGARARAVEVTATNSEVTIDTTSATIGNTFDVVASIIFLFSRETIQLHCSRCSLE